MKKFLLALVASFALFSAGQAYAFKSDHFKGSYQVISQDNAPVTGPRQFVSLDVDRLEVMWSRYASGAFPADLEPLRSEPTMLIRFTGRNTTFFTLEGNALITATYMSVRTEDGQYEMRLRPDGKFDVAVTEKDVTTFYVFARL